MKLLPGWARTYRHELTDREQALRLLWSPLVTEVNNTGEFVIPDDTIDWIGQVLGLSESPHNSDHHNTVIPQHQITVTT